MARRGLRGYSEYKVGHIHIERAFQGFRSENRPRKDAIVELDKEIKNADNQIQNSRKEMQTLLEEMERVTNKMTSNVSAKVQGMTSVEALQALQTGNKENTMCTICLEHLGHSDRDGLVTVFQCSHLMCRHCFLQLENSKKANGDRLTCSECRKPITSTIVVDPSKVEDTEVVTERKNSAKRLVEKAAKMLQDGNGILNPELWEALYHSIELKPGLDISRDRQCPAISGDLLGHIRNATKMKPNSTPKCRSENPEATLSSKFRALLRDLPKDDLSVVFTSSKAVLQHLLVVLEIFDYGCRALFTGQKEAESKAALDDWHNDDNVTVLVVQAGAAACGLTLTAARKLFLMEPFRKYEVCVCLNPMLNGSFKKLHVILISKC
jgi:hypothetical protein